MADGLKDDDKGYTNLIVQSKKGEEILQILKEHYEIFPSDINQAIRLDGSMILHSAAAHEKRTVFYNKLEHNTSKEVIGQLIPISKMDHVIEKFKIIVYRLGIYRLLKHYFKS